jgi:monoamine oxidase
MNYDVIIVGAGAAGLMAAYELSRKNKSVLVLEARDRIGGRIYTIPAGTFSTDVQAGAEFIHGEAAITMKVLQEAHIDHYEMHGEMYQLERGELVKQDFFQNEWRVMIDALEKVRYDMPFHQFLDQKFPQNNYPEFFDSIRKFVEGYNAANMKDVSTLALKEEWTAEEEPQQFRPVGGYGELVNFMNEKILLQKGLFGLQHRVTEIITTKKFVQVKTDKLDFESSKVLVTLPISLIQNKSIQFTPSIPEYEKAATEIGFGAIIKFLFEFEHPFWEEGKTRAYPNLKFIFSDAPIPTWWSQLPDNRALLTGWLGGPRVHEMQLDQGYLFDQAILSLGYILNKSAEVIKKRIRAWHIENWLSDEYSLGGYSYPKLQTERAKKILNTPIHDTIFFAGEALDEGPATGTVEAAFSSGKEAAGKILKSL